MTDPEDIRALSEKALVLADKATPGPWVSDGTAVQRPVDSPRYGAVVIDVLVSEGVAKTYDANDASFIAFAREALPTLATEVLRLSDLVDRQHAEAITLMARLSRIVLPGAIRHPAGDFAGILSEVESQRDECVRLAKVVDAFREWLASGDAWQAGERLTLATKALKAYDEGGENE